MNDLQKSLAPVLDAYRQAVFNRDITAFMNLYAPDVRVFDAWGVWSYEGADAWRKMVHVWFTSLVSERVTVFFEDVTVIGGHDIASLTSIVTYAIVTPEGNEIRAMQNRLSWTLKFENGAWKIVHEHTSAPAGFDDQKAILQRPKTQ